MFDNWDGVSALNYGTVVSVNGNIGYYMGVSKERENASMIALASNTDFYVDVLNADLNTPSPG